METTEFSGAPQGDDSRPDAAAPERTWGSSPRRRRPRQPPSRAPSRRDRLEPEPRRRAAAEAARTPLDDAVPSFDPTSFDSGSLLAPEESVPDATSGLPMSLTIAAEEAATVDVESEPEPPQSFDYQAFHDDQGSAPGGAARGSRDASVATEDARSARPRAALSLSTLRSTQPPSRWSSWPTTEAEEAAYTRVSTEPSLAGDEIVLVDLLLHMLERGASDLHITAGARPAIRVNGELTQMDQYPVLTPPVIQRVMYAAITQRQREVFEEELELDFAYSVPGRARFRVNMYRQRDSVGAAFRIIPFEIKKLEDLGVPTQVANFAALPRGFVLVTGPTGSGKSTTLASLLDLANRQRKEHIMTCEDPIEFLHRHQMSLVNQREVGRGHQVVQERPQARAAPGPRHHPRR